MLRILKSFWVVSIGIACMAVVSGCMAGLKVVPKQVSELSVPQYDLKGECWKGGFVTDPGLEAVSLELPVPLQRAEDVMRDSALIVGYLFGEDAGRRERRLTAEDGSVQIVGFHMTVGLETEFAWEADFLAVALKPAAFMRVWMKERPDGRSTHVTIAPESAELVWKSRDRGYQSSIIRQAECLAHIFDQHTPDLSAFRTTRSDADPITLPAGMEIPLRFYRTVTSITSKPARKIEFRVASDVLIGDEVVFLKGTSAWGTVADRVDKRRRGKDSFSVELEEIEAIGGTQVPLQVELRVKSVRAVAGYRAGHLISAKVTQDTSLRAGTR